MVNPNTIRFIQNKYINDVFRCSHRSVFAATARLCAADFAPCQEDSPASVRGADVAWLRGWTEGARMADLSVLPAR